MGDCVHLSDLTGRPVLDSHLGPRVTQPTDTTSATNIGD